MFFPPYKGGIEGGKCNKLILTIELRLLYVLLPLASFLNSTHFLKGLGNDVLCFRLLNNHLKNERHLYSVRYILGKDGHS
jgi:hypothetical protein